MQVHHSNAPHCPACSGCHSSVPAVAPKAGNSQKCVGTDWKNASAFSLLFSFSWAL